MSTIRFILIFFVLGFFYSISSYAQESQNTSKVYISYTWTPIHSHGSNQLAVWIEDEKGNFICTLFATKYTASGGYEKRPVSLNEWTAKAHIKDTPEKEVDAITGATPKEGRQSIVWNCADKSGKRLPAGTYVVKMEANLLNADQMFFTGKITIGTKPQQTTGEITYTDPKLASGNVLFKDVLVEFK
jgi:hypothetical protein